MEMETASQSTLLPFPPKYASIDKRYRFSERVLPEVVLATIFKYMHPIDLVNGVSRVSRQWNDLAKSPTLYRHVRVLINRESADYGSAKAFLLRSCNHIEKLCLVYEADVFVDVLPDCMPNVKTLDIAFFPELAKGLDKLISCFPCVETLNMPYTDEVDSAIVSKLFSEGSFKRLRRICMISEYDISDYTMTKMCTWNRPLEVMNIRICKNLRALLDSAISSTLTHLYLNGFMDNAAFAVIGQLKNLKTLSLFSCLYTEDPEILQLKALSKLEHLHLDYCGQDCDMTPTVIAQFFRLPPENPSNFFPYRLKYLRMSDCYPFKLEAAQELVKSCPQLESLNISRNAFMSEEALAVLINNLSNLRFLDISELGDMQCGALRNLSDNELPKLRFLSLHATKVSRKILEELNLRRPDLFITNRSDYFINWDMHKGKPHFNKKFNGDLNAVLNDLAEMEGFCCMSNVVEEQY